MKWKKDNASPRQRPAQTLGTHDLGASKFRWLNEQLYTLPSEASFSMFQKDANLFTQYHAGFEKQMKQWPMNPVDIIIGKLKEYIESRPKIYALASIADMGCGDAKVYDELHECATVHSFDLVAHKPHITSCDIAHVPLKDHSVDYVVFSLSLMGTNFTDFLQEATRIVKPTGTIIIAEVTSRIPDAKKFIESLNTNFNLSCIWKDLSNSHFAIFEFNVKPGIASSRKAEVILKPCIYKRR